MTVFLILCVCMLLFACSIPERDMLKSALGISDERASSMAKHFADRRISIASIAPSQNPSAAYLIDAFVGYDVIAKDETQYLLMLRASGKGRCAILDNKLELVDGAIDITMFPELGLT